MHDTANDSSHAYAIIVPEIPILEPNNSTCVDSRNILICHLTVSNPLIRYDLSDLFPTDISDHRRVWKWWESEWEQVGNIAINERENDTKSSEDCEGFFHEKYCCDDCMDISQSEKIIFSHKKIPFHIWSSCKNLSNIFLSNHRDILEYCVPKKC